MSQPYLDVLDLYKTDDEVVQVLIFDQHDLKPVVHHLWCTWRVGPIPLTLHLSSFHFLGHHGDHIGLLLPDHLPEICQRGGKRTLARDVQKALVLHGHLDEVGVDVATVFAQGHSRSVNFSKKKKKRRNKYINTGFYFYSCRAAPFDLVRNDRRVESVHTYRALCFCNGFSSCFPASVRSNSRPAAVNSADSIH